MRPLGRAGWGLALVLLAVSTSDLQAAWCNVVQVCCFGKNRSSVSAYNPCCPPPPCCPQTVCTTRYVQRCYYQPVTTYETRTYYEPVTTYRTSYYWEPTTSYRYSCYYDPCTCAYQQVATPVTSYRLRSQCCPVQSFVAKCCSVPVTTYRQSFYYEPQTTCCSTAPPPCNGYPPVNGQPGVGEQRTNPQPGVGESRSTAPYDSNPQPGPGGMSFRQLPLNGAQPQRSANPSQTAPPPVAPPAVKLDRIVYAPGPNVEGQVLRDNQSPQPGTRLLFVSADRQGERASITADGAGEFRVTLASGGWLVYVETHDGKPVFNSKIDVQENQTRRVRLVSR